MRKPIQFKITGATIQPTVFDLYDSQKPIQDYNTNLTRRFTKTFHRTQLRFTDLEIHKFAHMRKPIQFKITGATIQPTVFDLYDSQKPIQDYNTNLTRRFTKTFQRTQLRFTDLEIHKFAHTQRLVENFKLRKFNYKTGTTNQNAVSSLQQSPYDVYPCSPACRRPWLGLWLWPQSSRPLCCCSMGYPRPFSRAHGLRCLPGLLLHLLRTWRTESRW
jgi:hypothetical protein